MTAALEGGEWSAARPGRTLPPGKTRYPLYRRLGGLQGRSGRAENFVPTGIRSRTVQSIVSRYSDWATQPNFKKSRVTDTQKKEAASCSETSVAIHQTTQCNIPEDSDLRQQSCENLQRGILYSVWEWRERKNVRTAHWPTLHNAEILYSLRQRDKMSIWSAGGMILTGEMKYWWYMTGTVRMT